MQGPDSRFGLGVYVSKGHTMNLCSFVLKVMYSCNSENKYLRCIVLHYHLWLLLYLLLGRTAARLCFERLTFCGRLGSNWRPWDRADCQVRVLPEVSIFPRSPVGLTKGREERFVMTYWYSGLIHRRKPCKSNFSFEEDWIMYRWGIAVIKYPTFKIKYNSTLSFRIYIAFSVFWKGF